MPAMTVQEFTVKKDEAGNPKKDNFGNTQMMIKFEESAETVYKAVKDPTTMTKGKLMYGTIVEGQYGFKFQADPYNQPGSAPSQPYSAPQQTALPVATDDTREILLALYKAVTGEEYGKTVKHVTQASDPREDAPDVSYEDLDAEIGF